MRDRFAAISDIHGNIWALEAVLADIRARGISTVVNLGDHVHGPLEPGATADLLMRSSEMICISGNQDRVLPDSTRVRLNSKQLEWLHSHSPAYTLDDVLLCHGTPESDETYWLETVTAEGARFATQQEVDERLGAIEASLVLCGHTHVPRVVESGGVLIVNPGSVGLPAYSDDAPFPHKMETGSPHARYAVLKRHADGWNVDLIAIPYEQDAAVACASRNGRDDWARRLRSGRA